MQFVKERWVAILATSVIVVGFLFWANHFTKESERLWTPRASTTSLTGVAV
jgi:hypothetical protein